MQLLLIHPEHSLPLLQRQPEHWLKSHFGTSENQISLKEDQRLVRTSSTLIRVSKMRDRLPRSIFLHSSYLNTNKIERKTTDDKKNNNLQMKLAFFYFIHLLIYW